MRDQDWQVISVASLSFPNLSRLCVSGLLKKGTISPPVGFLFGFAQLAEVRCEPGLAVVERAKCLCLHA